MRPAADNNRAAAEVAAVGDRVADDGAGHHSAKNSRAHSAAYAVGVRRRRGGHGREAEAGCCCQAQKRLVHVFLM